MMLKYLNCKDEGLKMSGWISLMFGNESITAYTAYYKLHFEVGHFLENLVNV